MDFISDNLIFIVFIVITVVSQIGRMLVKNAERRKREDRGESAEAAVYDDPASEYGEDEDEAFSAWALSVDDETAAADSAAVLPASSFQIAAAPRPADVPFFAPLAASVPGPSPSPALTAVLATAYAKDSAWDAGSAPGAAARATSVSVRNKARSAGFPEKLSYLPPLKRAVVLAEILGPPKGF